MAARTTCSIPWPSQARECPEGINRDAQRQDIPDKREAEDGIPPRLAARPTCSALEAGGVDKAMHDHQGCQQQGKAVPRRHVIGNQNHFFGRRDIEAEEESADHHDSQFRKVAGLLLILFGIFTKLAPGQQGPQRCGYCLKHDDGSHFRKRGLGVDNSENGQDKPAHDKADAVGNKRVAKIILPAPGALETDMMRQEHQHWKAQCEQQKDPPAVEVEAQFPQFHGHEHRQPEDQCAGSRAAKIKRQRSTGRLANRRLWRDVCSPIKDNTCPLRTTLMRRIGSGVPLPLRVSSAARITPSHRLGTYA